MRAGELMARHIKVKSEPKKRAKNVPSTKEQKEIKTVKKNKKLKMPEEGKYVYGIIPYTETETETERVKNFGNIGIENNSKVYTINYKDIAAVVSDAPVKEYPLTEDYIRKHEKVARTVMKNCSIVPAAFGQVFKNQKILRVLMKNAYKTLKESLKLIGNKAELGVKAILSKEAIKSLDEKKKKEFEKKSAEIFKQLNKKAGESVKGRLFSNRLILNSSFLVDKSKIKNFSDEVDKLSNKYKDLKISYSGPWPPYSFVYIKIGAKGIDVGRREMK